MKKIILLLLLLIVPMILSAQTKNQVNKISKPEVVSIYPNPATNSVSIRYKDFSINKIEIYDVLGKIVLERYKLNNNSIELNVSDLNSGIYLIKISTKNKNITRKLVIR